MDEERKKARRLVIGLFVACLCIAVACFGIFIYIFLTSRGVGVVSDRIVTVAKILVFLGSFFLVVAFGHLLPILISDQKREQ